MLKNEAFCYRTAWAIAMRRIAEKHGPGSPLYKAMGSLAWGRYDGEPCPSDSKDRAIEAVGYLKGVRDALMRAAEIAGWRGYEDLRDIHREVRGRLDS